ncbi:MAG: DNA methyltransferase, partial [bacterium]
CDRCGRRRDKVIDFDLEKLREIEEREIPYWYPRNEFRGQEPRRNYARGIYRVDQFFTKRNLWALARLWKEAEEKGEFLKFLLSAVMFSASKANRERLIGRLPR